MEDNLGEKETSPDTAVSSQDVQLSTECAEEKHDKEQSKGDENSVNHVTAKDDPDSDESKDNHDENMQEIAEPGSERERFLFSDSSVEDTDTELKVAWSKFRSDARRKAKRRQKRKLEQRGTREGSSSSEGKSKPPSTVTETAATIDNPSTSEQSHRHQQSEDHTMRSSAERDKEREAQLDTSTIDSSEHSSNFQDSTPHSNRMDSDSSISFGGYGDSSSTSQDYDDERDLPEYDPTPWNNLYPQPNWYSCKQLISREYGRNVKPGPLNKKSFNFSFNPSLFSRYAYNSLFFIQRMELTDTLESHTGCVNCLNFNSTGALLCSGSDDLHINIWDWHKKKLKDSYSSGHTSNVFQSRWCLNDSKIVTCSRDGQVRICDVNNINGSSKRLALHSAPTHRLTFTSPDVVLSCGEDASVYEIDLRTESSTLLLVARNSPEHKIPLYSIHCNMTFTPNYFAISGRDPLVSIYDRRFLRKPSTGDASSSRHSLLGDESPRLEDASTPSPVMQLCPKDLVSSQHSVTCAVYNSTGSKILMSYNDEDLYVFNTKTGEQEAKYQGHRNSSTIKGCSWFGDEFVLSGSDDGYIYGWDTTSRHIVMSVQSDTTGAVNCIEPHPFLPIIASSGLDDTVKIWQPTLDHWPRALTGIKRRICVNMRDRHSEAKRFSFNAGGPIVWLFMRHIQDRIINNRRDEDSESQEDDASDEAMDASCRPF